MADTLLKRPDRIAIDATDVVVGDRIRISWPRGWNRRATFLEVGRVRSVPEGVIATGYRFKFDPHYGWVSYGSPRALEVLTRYAIVERFEQVAR